MPEGKQDSEKEPIDPTKNVLDLVTAAVLRLDDLRLAETRRQDDLRTQSEKHAEQIRKLDAEYQDKLREAEAKRIDAIRVVDVNAVSVASVRSADQATVLATQVQTTAETLRSLVTTSASSLASAHAAVTGEIMKRLSELERAKYEGAGRSTVADPQMAALMALVESLRESRSTSTGRSGGIQSGWSWIIGAVGLIAGLIGIFAALSR